MSDYEDRRYSNYYSPRKCAAEIAMECVLNGKSDMWSGSLEDRDAIAKILNPINIFYTDDFFGEWSIVQPRGVQKG